MSCCLSGGQGQNRTADTGIFSIRGTVYQLFPICLSTSAKEEFSEQHAVRRSQELSIFPYFSMHDYTGITRTPGQTKLLEGLAKRFDHSLDRGGGGKTCDSHHVRHPICHAYQILKSAPQGDGFPVAYIQYTHFP